MYFVGAFLKPSEASAPKPEQPLKNSRSRDFLHSALSLREPEPAAILPEQQESIHYRQRMGSYSRLRWPEIKPNRRTGPVCSLAQGHLDRHAGLAEFERAILLRCASIVLRCTYGASRFMRLRLCRKAP